MHWHQDVVMDRWVELKATSPSGKALFVCRFCGSKTPAPVKECAAPPEVEGVPYSKTCAELEREYVDKLIHPIRRAALPTLNTLVQRVHSTLTNSGKTNVLRRDRELVLDVVRGAFMSHGKNERIHIWQIFDEIEDIRKELRKK